MKKNISINISGIIFHIEEDGYENLKRYLDSINRYFSTFEDSSEILADIESRIAEIFLSKLNEEKQVITAEDVNSLIATMGSVNDFRAAEETQEQATSSSSTAGTGAAGDTFNESRTYVPPKQLRRDQKRKILGGVCAGLGNYFNLDPLWFRLLFAALLFAGGFAVLVYVVMWIIVPGSYELEEPEFGKKMFRDPQSKIIGGVSGGVAAYFGIDVILVRVLFIVLTFAGGLGVFLYIILWVSLPEARTITDKMQMQGEPVTLSNIESNIKRNFNIREGESENTLTKIILFPFRLIGLLLTALGNIIEPLADVVRVVIGVLIILVGVSLVFSIVVTAAVLFGLFAGGVFATPWMTEFHEMDLPIEVFTRAFPGWIAIAGTVAALIPSIFLILLGASTIAKKLVFRATVGWSMLALFFVSVAMLAVGIPRIVYAFHEEGEYKVEKVYNVAGKTAVLRLN
jgi:phage shock protein PspC (stress-responsive transcriptional regulator)